MKISDALCFYSNLDTILEWKYSILMEHGIMMLK